MPTFQNPNTSAQPIPMRSAHFAALAKTGCSKCHGQGRHKVRRDWVVCDCVAKALRYRDDWVIGKRDALMWRGTASIPAPELPRVVTDEMDELGRAVVDASALVAKDLGRPSGGMVVPPELPGIVDEPAPVEAP